MAWGGSKARRLPRPPDAGTLADLRKRVRPATLSPDAPAVTETPSSPSPGERDSGPPRGALTVLGAAVALLLLAWAGMVAVRFLGAGTIN